MTDFPANRSSYMQTVMILALLTVFSLSGIASADNSPFIVCSDAGTGGYEAFPDVCLTASGELICVFYAGYSHVSDPSADLPKGARISMVRSADYGATWSAAEIVTDTPIDDRDPSITELPDGDLLVIFMTYDSQRTSGTHQVYSVRSSDGGATWSEPKPVPSPFTQLEAVSTPPRLVSGGRLLLPVYGNFTGDERRYKQAAVLESRDYGLTWSILAEIHSDKYILLEPDITELPGNRLLLVMRDVMTRSESTDGGRTWSDPIDMGIKGHCPYLLLTSNDILLCGIRNPEAKNTSILHSIDYGASWSGPTVIDDVLGAYPSMAELPDGRILCVYYTEGKGSDIRGVYLEADSDGVRIVK